MLDVERPSAPATGVVQSIYEVRHDLKSHLLLGLLESDAIDNALVFTRTKHRANRLADFLERRGVACERIHGNRSQGQRTKALEGFKSGLYRVLVATDVAARGIDVEALSHVDQLRRPQRARGLHPPRRTHRARRRHRRSVDLRRARGARRAARDRAAVGKPIPRRRLEGFDYEAKPAERFEIPIAERLAAHRGRKADDRARAQAKHQRSAPAPARARDGRAPVVSQERARVGRGAASPPATARRLVVDCADPCAKSATGYFRDLKK